MSDGITPASIRHTATSYVKRSCIYLGSVDAPTPDAVEDAVKGLLSRRPERPFACVDDGTGPSTGRRVGRELIAILRLLTRRAFIRCRSRRTRINLRDKIYELIPATVLTAEHVGVR